uniref:ZP domain-containing protein n=1 Tax=Caenorhabditis tropicalis TaxID=1561998 RepID=A0A1I7UL26_9PELO
MSNISFVQVDPRGMYYGITVVVSFHPLFITKVDQAYHVKCFFEEANKGLTAELGVSMIPTTELEARHGIPGCTYSIHSSTIDELDAGRPAGQPIQFARVGDRVLHQWHCNDQMYGVLINNCYVTDGFGKKSDVIDDKGCPIDPILITGIRYSSDLQRAYAESSVFKFADKPGVWFFCQVQMCMKKHGMCDGITPPSCGSKSRVTSIGGDDGFEEEKPQRKTKKPPVQDYDYEAEKPRTTRAPPQRTTPSSDYDYDNESPKLHSPNSHSYNSVTPPLDYETVTLTAFSPPINPATVATSTQESVSKTFETEDDLASSVTSEPKSKKIGKSDYNDYDEVTIPPNLTDLLANLPDDISSDSIQKMLRDSVDNPKALLAEFGKLMKNKKMKPDSRKYKSRNLRELKPGDLRSGEKIDQIEVDWTSTRRRDVPVVPEFNSNNKYDKPMLAGQLLIFDLDEEPPIDIETQKSSSTSKCSISKDGLLAVFAGFGALSSALLAMIAFLIIRLKSQASPIGQATPIFKQFQYAQKRFFESSS